MVLSKEIDRTRKDAKWLQSHVKSLQKIQEEFAKATPKNSAYLNLDALIAVHLTRHFPDGGTIFTTHQMTSWLGSLWGFYKVRETIHFTLNGPVASHIEGGWEDAKYAILIPVKAIIRRITNLAPHDTFIIGKLKLPLEAEILGKKEDLTGKDSGKAKMVPFKEGEAIADSVRRRIKEKGYLLIENNEHGWRYPSLQNGILETIFRIGKDYPRRDALAWAYYDVGNPSPKLTSLFEEAARNMGFESRYHAQFMFGEVEEFLKGFRVLEDKVFKKKAIEPEKILNAWKDAGDLLFTLGTIRDQLAELRITRGTTYSLEEERAEEEALERVRTILVQIKAEIEKWLKEYVPKKMIQELSKGSFSRIGTLRLERKLVWEMKEALQEFNLRRFRKLLAKLEKAEGKLAKECTFLKEEITRFRKFLALFPNPPQKLKDVSNTLELVDKKFDYLIGTFESWLFKRFEELQELVKEERWGEIGEKLNEIEKRMNETTKYIQDWVSLLPHKK